MTNTDYDVAARLATMRPLAAKALAWMAKHYPLSGAGSCTSQSLCASRVLDFINGISILDRAGLFGRDYTGIRVVNLYLADFLVIHRAARMLERRTNSPEYLQEKQELDAVVAALP